MEHPLLLPKLQTALSVLYSNNNNDNSLTPQNNRHDAHDFLLSFKSSNVRRMVVSRIQSQKDRSDGHTLSIGEECAGSIFLSCLALILQSNNSHHNTLCTHERIFAAQTLNHRCRSIKLVESLDIEAEDGVECGVARLVVAWEEIRAERARILSSSASGENNSNVNQITTAAVGEKSILILTAWLERYVPMLVHRCGGGSCSSAAANGTFCNGAELLAIVLQRHSTSLIPSASDNADEEKQEDQIKGTLIMLTLAVAMYVSAFCDYEEEHQYHQVQQQQHQHRSPWANSVLSDLGSALSITALRIRYRPTTDKYATPLAEPSCPALIDMLVNAVNAIKESAEVYFSQKMQQQQQQQNYQTIQSAIHRAHQYAIQRSIAACIKALPETVLLPLGQEDTGHRIPSVDRACLRAASMELRAVGRSNQDNNELGTGMDKAWKVLVESERGDGNQAQFNHQDGSASRLLECCEAWARYVAVPIHVIEVTVGSLAVGYLQPGSSNYKAQVAAFQYLVSIFDAASQSISSDDILTAALGVGASGHRGKGGGASSNKKNANTKKKQGSKSKKRHEKRLGRAIAVQDNQDGGATDAADKELLARRNAACVAAAAIFGVSLADASIMDDGWGLRLAATSPSTSTHGICSTVAATAASVLPQLLFLERGEGEGELSGKWRCELFSAIVLAIRRMCASSSRDIRALAYEPLMILHTSLNSVAFVSLRMEHVAVDAICECTLALATSCGYPSSYFANLSENNDEELEVERNDIRDVARSVCSLDSGDISQHKPPSILILQRIIGACYSAMKDAELPPETAVHILSALAKPLNKLGKKYKDQPSETGCAILAQSLQALGSLCEKLNSSFDSHSISQILPLSRLALMGASSLSPMFSSLAEVTRRPAASDMEKALLTTFARTFQLTLQHSILSTARIPEIVAASTLDSTRYDIKGAMRGPGGEDHVGCIALLRMTHESDCLTSIIFEVYGATFLHDLSSLYQGLKSSELERGVGCDYGVGVAPYSRRMILRVISRLSLFEMKGKDQQISEGHQLLQTVLDEMRSQKETPFSAEKLFRLTESSFDLSFFSPGIVASLFNKPSDDLQVIFECAIMGYSRLLFTSDTDSICQQWGRLRGGTHSVLRASLKDAITDYSASIIVALIKAECEAATVQSNQGAGSTIFLDNVVGEEMVHAGVYIMLIKECLDSIARKKGGIEQHIGESRICLSVLKDVALTLTPLLLHQSPEASAYVDPRPTIAEAFFLTVQSLVSICRKHEQIAASLVCDGAEPFLGECLSTAMSLIFLKNLGTKKAPAPAIQKGMSLDGPHTLAVFSFVSEAMLLGPTILSAGGKTILSAIQVNNSFGQDCLDQSNIGAVILTSSLLRAVSGALPPWAVEETPTLFRSLYVALGSDCDRFIQVLSASTKVKASAPFGGVQAGELLAGRYLDVSDRHIESFLVKSRECTKGDWKKLKVCLKNTCGGKKKDSGFNLKPQNTSWECERL
ncbi:hypothetical protein ACHAXR_009992 [Thalassiosira sp. AJA248-18]